MNPDGTVSADARAAVAGEMDARYPGHGPVAVLPGRSKSTSWRSRASSPGSPR
ncbi:hypothetical protein [Sorangium sp. So ce1078]|uniref:hypothetical protein n=1 Tax=Sorangium sp. So ce1078 TaxID=3133329 RepID=UPI003F62E555